MKMRTEVEMFEDKLTCEMVDFYKEHELIINLGLARSKSDVNTMKFYRITSTDDSLIKHQNTLQMTNARIICQGQWMGLTTCDGTIPITNPLLPSQEGHLLLQMGGPLRAPSKALASCSCGANFMLYADATVGKPDECYVVIATVSQSEEAKFGINPTLEFDALDVVPAK